MKTEHCEDPEADSVDLRKTPCDGKERKELTIVILI
jgi:hypothetical protein